MQSHGRDRRRALTAVVALLQLAMAASVQAQRAPERLEPIVAPPALMHTTAVTDSLAYELRRAGMPTWLKWGLVGGVAFGTVAVLTSGMNIEADAPDPAKSAAIGFGVGFAAVGGGVALWQLLCRPDSWSRRHGLCDRHGVR